MPMTRVSTLVKYSRFLSRAMHRMLARATTNMMARRIIVVTAAFLLKKSARRCFRESSEGVREGGGPSSESKSSPEVVERLLLVSLSVLAVVDGLVVVTDESGPVDFPLRRGIADLVLEEGSAILRRLL
jgi:hypothetical protein